MKELLVYKLDPKAILPTRAKDDDAGLDLYALEDTFIPLGTTVKVSTGISANIHPGYVGLIKGRSSLGAKGLDVFGGVIDSGYVGEWSVLLSNVTCQQQHRGASSTSPIGYWVREGDRIAQVLIQEIKYPTVKETTYKLNGSRGNNSFGSSGR